MADTLIIFVDSLRHDQAAAMDFLGQLPTLHPVRPGFGYSVNIHAELFAGLHPDDVGYFCEWMVNPSAAPGRRYRPLLPLLDTIFRPYVLNRGLQRLLTRGYRPDHVMPNIPLRDLDKFAVAGEHILSPRFPQPTLFSEHPGLHVLSYRGIAPKGSRDEAIARRALAALAEHRQLFVPLPDLDGLGHSHGVDRPEHNAHLARLDGWVAELAQEFRRRYPAGHLFVVSDHGMANVRGGVRLDIEARCGQPGLRRYLTFSDATLLRGWIYDETLRQPLADVLHSLPHGQVLTDEERQHYGLTNPDFGDVILVLEEGYCFQPSTFARHIPKGMHGYHPELPSQWGIFAHDGPPLGGPPPQDMVQVYPLLQAALEGELP
ncbi:MAG: alkaline phosphatase family protein [Chloroflexi bacterium]|nr:alkaline phosphatase family protein [Chloroflexota bacterium]